MKHSILYPRLRATAAALALALVAAGCAVGPDYQKPQSAPVTLASPEQALFSNGQLQRDWWKQLQDPQLDRLIGLALERNHDIRIAQARLAESRAVLDEKELDQLPTVTAGGRYERSLSQTNPGPEGERNLARSYRAGFDASWEIDLFGRLRRAAERGRAQPGAGRRSGAGPHRGRRRGGAQLFRAAWRRAAAGGARANLRTQEDSLRVIQAMVSAGRGDEGDLASARAELATVQASVPQQAAARRLAQYRIAVLAGLRPAELGELDAARPQAPLAARLPIGDVGALLSRRPDVLAAERNMAAANADVGVATAELYPRIDLGGFLGFVAARRRLRQCLQPRLQRIARPQLAGAASAHGAGAQARRPGPLRGRGRALRADCAARGGGAGNGFDRLRREPAAPGQPGAGRGPERPRGRAGAAALQGRHHALPDGAGRATFLLRAQDAVAVAETASYTSLIALYKALGGGWQAPGDAGGEGAQQGRQGRWDRTAAGAPAAAG